MRPPGVWRECLACCGDLANLSQRLGLRELAAAAPDPLHPTSPHCEPAVGGPGPHRAQGTSTWREGRGRAPWSRGEQAGLGLAGALGRSCVEVTFLRRPEARPSRCRKVPTPRQPGWLCRFARAPPTPSILILPPCGPAAGRSLAPGGGGPGTRLESFPALPGEAAWDHPGAWPRVHLCLDGSPGAGRDSPAPTANSCSSSANPTSFPPREKLGL